MARLKGKIALVTGGGQGIGRGITDRFVEEGALVIVAQRSVPKNLPIGAIHRPTDLSDPASILALCQNIIEEDGTVDTLVNNAGVMFEKPVAEMSEDDWDAMMNVNLKAPFLLMKHLVPSMCKAGGGSIINIGSIEGLASNPRHAAYSASKGGIHGLTHAIAIDHGNDGIRCNAIAPGWIRSELSDAYVNSMPDPERVNAELKVMHPVGRLGEPTDIGNMAVFLASDESSFVTGQTFVVDGGRMKKIPLPLS
jgi:NAD(P)-dependent dehydrogenase (short-subunit alcohol dehydrogenase family)